MPDTADAEEGERQDDSALRGPLLRYALRLSGNRDDAEDMVQDAFCKMLTAAGYPLFPEQFLRRVIDRLWIDRIRTRLRRPEEALEEAQRCAAHSPDPVLCVVRQEQIATFRALLETLSEAHRQAVWLSIAREWEGRQVAAQTGLTEANIRQIVRRFRIRLQRVLGGAEE
jgi:RNA polymerase sigma factor (sigma-70 family)